MLKPAAAMPVNNIDGTMIAYLQKYTPDLKRIFDKVFISLTSETWGANPEDADALAADPFFHVIRVPQPATIGEVFRTLYRTAAAESPPDQVLHLCFTDRVVYALQSEHRDAFIRDMQASADLLMPLIYERSELAWNTHPRNYREIEHLVTMAGEWLFGVSLDFCWCHFAAQAGVLKEILPGVQGKGLDLEAEIVLALLDTVQSKEVDWLAWEDPFILYRDPAELKAEREADPEENRKRLNYVVPMLQRLVE